jgi:hypothetical protein
MDAKILGAVLAIATASLMLRLREFILRVGKPKNQVMRVSPAPPRKYPIEIVSDPKAEVEEQRNLAETESDGPSIQVEEFVAELRATARSRQEQEGDCELHFTAPPH